MLIGLFSDKPILRKFFILGCLVLFSTLIFFMLGGLMVQFLYGVDLINNSSALSDLSDPNTIAAMKLLQLVTTGIGMFLIPSVAAAILFDKQPKDFLSMKSKFDFKIIAVSILMMFAAVPFINLLLSFNDHLVLPDFLSSLESWMKEKENQAMKITEALLAINSTGDLIYNLVIIALMPAIGEELLFRGVLQRLFKELTKNIHVTIFITAALFSAVHMQFYGFLPRMFLGVLFGYMLVWSGSIWVPIIAHFINNAAAVVFSYLDSLNKLPFNQDTIGTEQNELPIAIFSILLIGIFAFFIKKSSPVTEY